MKWPLVPRAAASRSGRIILAVAGAEALIVGGIYGWERGTLSRGAGRTEFVRVKSATVLPTWWPLERDGLARPPAVAADGAGLTEDEEVIGVVAGGAPRAYRLSVLSDVHFHIVNDVVGGVPVSVLYCDLSDCARAYTGPPGSLPLPIGQAGMKDGDLILRVGDVYYQHRTGEALGGTDAPTAPDPGRPPLPFPPLPFTRTTWGEWRRRHPGTDVFAEAPRDGSADGATSPPPAPPGARGE